MGTPAGLRSLQAASSQLQQLQAADEQQRREQRRGPVLATGRQEQESEAQLSRRLAQHATQAMNSLSHVGLLAALAAAGLQPAGSPQLPAVMCRLLVEALPSLVAAVQRGTDALTPLSPPESARIMLAGRPTLEQQAWITAAQACQAVAQVLEAAAAAVQEPDAPACERSIRSLLAALQLRALLHGLERSRREWEAQLPAGVPPDPAAAQHLAGAAAAAEAYAFSSCCQLSSLYTLQIIQAGQAPDEAAGQALDSSFSEAAARAGRAEPEQLAEAHSVCASLLHRLTAEGGSTLWAAGAPLPQVLANLFDWAAGRWAEECAADGRWDVAFHGF